MSQFIEVIYDIYNEFHKGNKESSENSDRIKKIVNYINNDTFLKNILTEYNENIVLLDNWDDKVTLNCSSCTHILNKNICHMCFSKQTHKWNYVNDIDGDTTYQTPYTDIIVHRASEIIKLGIEKLLNNNKKMVFCLTRPPGHHSCQNKKVGFCHKNHAIDALDIFKEKSKKVIILDIDAHHGDGTETELLKREYGYYISIHGYGENVYPNTGKFLDSDRILNIPLDKYSTDDIWLKSFETLVLPKIYNISPDIIILSCGFDGYHKDIIAPLNLSEDFYSILSEKLCKLNIPILSILEGGYYLNDLGVLVKNLLTPFIE